MLLRIRSPEGTFRIEVDTTTKGEDFAQKILDTITSGEPVISSVKLSNTPRGGELVPLSALQGRVVGDLGFSHGDMLFLSYDLSTSTPDLPTAGPSTSTPGLSTTDPKPQPQQQNIPLIDLTKIKEAPVDDYWRARDGKIPRGRDEKMCRHGAKGMCDYCMPLEPFDSTYQATQQIKHLSFHSYLRKLTSTASSTVSSSSSLPPLTPLSYLVQIPCHSGSHASWPAGICSKCQPSAITLASQPFRSIDHVEFSHPALIDKFLASWRSSGKQRFGLLIGRYEKYESVPMGIKAVVEAIHEIGQEGNVDGVELGEGWQEEERRIAEVAKACGAGLEVVGMVHTDLTSDPEDRTKQLYKRHPQSYYLSSSELIFSAHQQLAHPIATRSSPTGSYSSRFVTCVLTGSADSGIEVLSFMASEQGCAMVQADMVEGSVEPGIVRVKKEEGSRYIPDVFYSYKNEYGIQVKESAKPCFPVEYLMVNLTHGFPNNPSPLFLSSEFPIENRSVDQTITKVCKELVKVSTVGGLSDPQNKDKIKALLSDWHLVYFLQGCGIFDQKAVNLVLKVSTAHTTGDDSSFEELIKTDGWQTLSMLTDEQRNNAAAVINDDDGFEQIPEHILQEMRNAGISSPANVPSAPAAGAAPRGPIACPHCTYENDPSNGDCEICGLPLVG